MENKRWTVWGLEYKNVAFSVKTACMLFIVCDGLSCPAARGTAGLLYCSVADVNSVWGLDLRETGRQSLSSQQPTSPSATLAVTKSIMFGLLCHVQHHRGLWIFCSVLSALIFFFSPSIFSSLSWAEWCLQSGQHAKQKRKGLCIWLPLVKTLLHSGWEGIVVCGVKWEMIVVMSFSCVHQETVYTTVLLVAMAFLVRMLMAYSPRLVPFSSFRSGFLRINIFIKWGYVAWHARFGLMLTAS